MKIVIVFGGISFEHEISIVSAIAMKDLIKDELIYLFLDKNRDFYHIPTNIIKSRLFSLGEYTKYNKVYLGKKAFFTKTLLSNKTIAFDWVLNLSHGGDGEDGMLSSLFEFYDIPYLGPRVEACSISFNKFLTKAYASSLNIKTIAYKHYTKNDEVIINQYPIIIKPSRLGSSIGVSIVNNQNELEYALDVAYEFDDSIIIEPFVKGIKEYNLAGCKIQNEFHFSIVEEPQKVDFLDFDKKYLDFSRTSTAKKADISSNIKEKLKNTFKILYNTMFDGSLIRCDFFVVEDEIYLNEINSIPGSMANYLFDDFASLLKNLASNLPKNKKIPITYEYVNKIQASKGK